MLENHVRQLYRLLNHKGFKSRIGWLHVPSKAYKETYVEGEEAVVQIGSQYNGTHNLFISRAARNPDGSFHHSSVVSFDLDPIRDKDTASTDRQHLQAMESGAAILKRYPGGYLADSGNGCLLIYRLPSPITSGLDYYDRESIFIDELQSIVGEGIKVDKVPAHANAVIKLLGTMSTKGPINERRYSRFIDWPYIPYKSPPNLMAHLDGLQTTPRSSVVIQGDPIRRIKEAQQFLSELKAERVDAYDDWLKVGMALKEFGISGLSLWQEWSKRSPKYEDGACEKKWLTFDESPTITLASLAFWAKADKAGFARPMQVHGTYFDELFRKDCNARKPITTGLRSLDQLLGPLPTGQITTFAARSGFGKTTFACTVAEHLRKSGLRVLYVPTELSAREIMHKFSSIHCSVPLQNFLQKSFTEAEIKRIHEYQKEFEKSPISILDEDRPSMKQIRDFALAEKPDVIIHDHPTHVETNWDKIITYIQELKELASELDIPVIMTSQMNEPPRSKEGSEQKSIRSDVRGSQGIIFISSIFAFFNNPYEVKTNFQPVEIQIAKNRFGRGCGTVELMVDKEISRFMEGTKHESANLPQLQ